MAGAAVGFMSLYLSAGALTPLLVLYRQQWSFPATMLTLAFAVYALGFLVAVLTLGSLSDHIGRRPVIIGALIVQLVSDVLFLTGSDVSWVVAGRVIQGIASGAATAAFTAALVEFAPPHKKKLGTVLGSIGLTGGLAAGSLLAGVAIQFTPSANTIAFVSLIVLSVLGIIVTALSRETATRTPGTLRSMIPRVAMPPAARREFAGAAPVVAAVWMLAGLSGGLAPSLVRSVFHLDSGFLNGLTGFIAPAVSVVVGLSLARIEPRHAMTTGIYTSIAGAVGISGGVLGGSLVLMIIGQALAGIGFGASFTAALRLVIPRAADHQRAGVVAGIYVVAYLAFGVPIIVAGQLAGPVGDITTVVGYSALTVVFALLSLAAQFRISHPRKRNDPKLPANGQELPVAGVRVGGGS